MLVVGPSDLDILFGLDVGCREESPCRRNALGSLLLSA